MTGSTRAARLALLRDAFYMVSGTFISAVSVVMFFNPANLAPGGVSGWALLLNRIFGLSIGVLVVVLNLPILALGMYKLGGWRFLARTVVATLLYGAFTALLEQTGLIKPITQDIVLNTLYAGLVGGLGTGLVLRGRATTGGTDIIALLLMRARGMPLSQSYVLADAAVFITAGAILGWDKALYAFVANYVGGLAAEAVSSGANVSRTATIITEKPELVSKRVLEEMQRGVTEWTGTGKFTGQQRPILFIVVGRAEIATLKAIVHDADPEAFVVIGQAQEVFGEGFRRLNRE
ncbi:MAG: YitT family protein [Thermoflexales bacterium]|nr:YitT family protein [Thermoflexales bacterium]